jgi:FixJ family two-component response regulator
LNEEAETTILVADDEEGIRDIVRHHLEKEGYNVITSEDGKEAIDALKEHDISLTITDIKMPNIDGFGVVDFVKKHCNFVPVIVLTGYVDVEMAVSAMKKGCFDYITKPIKREELTETVRNALNKMKDHRKRSEFKIAEIYLLRDDGAVMFHERMNVQKKISSDIFGFMLTVIKTLIDDSSNNNQGLKGLQHSNFKVLIEEGEGYFLTVIGQGSDLKPIQDNMKKTVKDINLKFHDKILHFNGHIEDLEDIKKTFTTLINIGKEEGCIDTEP